MSDERCRACGAAVPPAAQWCSLCFADLRPQPELQSEPVAAAVATASPVASVPAPVATVPPPPEIAPNPIVPNPVVPNPVVPNPVAAALPAATWPCPRCGADVGISLDACPDCGAGFLAGASAATTARLPVVGDLTRMSSAERFLVAAGLALVIMVVLVVLAFLAGKVF